jgi:lipid A 3-O-deacylase
MAGTHLLCWRKFAAGAAGLLASGSVLAAPTLDHVSLELGTNSKIRMLRLAVQSDWNTPVATFDNTLLTGYWDLSLLRWRASAFKNSPGLKQNITGIGLSPVLRLQGRHGAGWYAEASVGIVLLSNQYNNNGHRLSTHFQFGEQLGFGYVFDNKWDAGILVRHFSNGGLKKPNSGVNFLLVKASRAF